VAELARSNPHLNVGGTQTFTESSYVDGSSTSLRASSSSFLVPCPTQAEEPEVEWLLREADAGRLEGFELVDLPPLPEWATPPMRRVAGFYAKVRSVRLWAGDERDVPFACRWVAAKLRLPKTAVHRALTQLEAEGVLVRTATLPGRGRRGTQLWAPGVLPGAAVGVECRAGAVGDAGEPELHRADEPQVGPAVPDGEDCGGPFASVRSALHGPYDIEPAGRGGERGSPWRRR
jgi:hypothetical protein